VAQASQDADVLAVILFGSVARGEQTARWDVDVCLALIPERIRERSIASRTRLEYLSYSNLDVQIFQALPLCIRHRVLKEGQALFVRDEARLYEVAFRTAQAFEDFKPIDYRYREQIAHVGP
jgi:uncharacterized protein